MGYQLIDSGEGRKLERFGTIQLIRPAPQALWNRENPDLWAEADASFSREKGWQFVHPLPSSWTLELSGLLFKIAPTEFGHLGLFPEHALIWSFLQKLVHKEMRILNLFAYSGGATLAAIQKGARVCHVDASKGMIQWAKENMHLNHLQNPPIRWISDDVQKFLNRERKRNSLYEGILLDPPTFGRGSKGEVFKIERDLFELIKSCSEVLSSKASFIILSCHTPGITPLVLHQMVKQIFSKGIVDSGELMLSSKEGYSIPSGCYIKICLT